MAKCRLHPFAQPTTFRKVLLLGTFLIFLTLSLSEWMPINSVAFKRFENFHSVKSTPVMAMVQNATNYVVAKALMTEQKKVKLERCPIKSPFLVGAVKENRDNVTLHQLDDLFLHPPKPEPSSKVDHGGHFYPTNCTAREKLAIIIPFRNRHHHLPILLRNLVPILRRQQLDFRIYVVEQEPGVNFNRGFLANVGFITALSRDRFDCMVLHDVDCIPLNDNILYQCGDNPMHLLSSGSKWNFKIPYYTWTGGVLLMSREQYIRINGYSNLYFGWGSEDDDVRIRIEHNNYKVIRYPKTIGRYYQIVHKRDEGNEENSIRFPMVRLAFKRSKIEGLRSTVFKVKSIEEKPYFIWIRVSVNMTKVLQTAPAYMQSTIKKLVENGKEFDKQGLGHAEDGDKFDISL